MPDNDRRQFARSMSRRRALAGGGAALVAGLAGCAGIGGEEESELQQQLGRVREATSQYEDPTVALDDGFQVSGPYVPGMGWHFTHPERAQRIGREGFSIEDPNLLTYLETDDGPTLGSVEYGAPAEAVPDDPDLFADENADATEEWHVHGAATHVFANGDGERTDPGTVPFDEWVTRDNWTEFSPPDDSVSAGDTVALNWGTPHGKEGETSERVADVVANHPDLRTLHAWVHLDNPEGVFNPVNPEYGGDDHSH